jgi:hypothetical protein
MGGTCRPNEMSKNTWEKDIKPDLTNLKQIGCDALYQNVATSYVHS